MMIEGVITFRGKPYRLEHEFDGHMLTYHVTAHPLGREPTAADRLEIEKYLTEMLEVAKARLKEFTTAEPLG